MGWSCRADAGKVLAKFEEACRKSTGSSNTYKAFGKRYFFEVSGVEHADGAITGSIHRFVDKGRCVRSGSFRIEGDGTITRAPAFLKKAAKVAPKGMTVRIDNREGTILGADADKGRVFGSIAEYDKHIRRASMAEGLYCMKVFVEVSHPDEVDDYAMKHEVYNPARRLHPSDDMRYMPLAERMRRYCERVIGGEGFPCEYLRKNGKYEAEVERCAKWLGHLDAEEPRMRAA